MKLTKVIGSNKSELAKIGGITPAVFILRGRWDESATLFPAPGCLLGYWIVILLCALSMKTINAITATDMTSKKTMKIYANRIEEVHTYLDSTKNPLHAERFLKYVLDKNNVKNKEFKMIGKRIRANGIVAPIDRKL